MKDDDGALPPADGDESMAQFCNFMLQTARTDEAKRLFRQFVEHERTQSPAHRNSARSSRHGDGLGSAGCAFRARGRVSPQ